MLTFASIFEEPGSGEFILSHEGIVTPPKGRYYSINEGNAATWDEPTRRYVEYLKQKDAATGRPYSLRYIGSLVADFHRTLLYGGVFLYPPIAAIRRSQNRNCVSSTKWLPWLSSWTKPEERYHTGTQNVLDIQATSLHDRVPIVMGSTQDVAAYEKFCANANRESVNLASHVR